MASLWLEFEANTIVLTLRNITVKDVIYGLGVGLILHIVIIIFIYLGYAMSERMSYKRNVLEM